MLSKDLDMHLEMQEINQYMANLFIHSYFAVALDKAKIPSGQQHFTCFQLFWYTPLVSAAFKK